MNLIKASQITVDHASLQDMILQSVRWPVLLHCTPTAIIPATRGDRKMTAGWWDLDNIALKISILALSISLLNLTFSILGVRDLWPRFSAWLKEREKKRWHQEGVEISVRGREIELIKECIDHIVQIKAKIREGSRLNPQNPRSMHEARGQASQLTSALHTKLQKIKLAAHIEARDNALANLAKQDENFAHLNAAIKALDATIDPYNDLLDQHNRAKPVD